MLTRTRLRNYHLNWQKFILAATVRFTVLLYSTTEPVIFFKEHKLNIYREVAVLEEMGEG